MKNRRKFIKTSLLGGAALVSATACTPAEAEGDANSKKAATAATKPIVISTWTHGEAANKVAWDILRQGGSALDAVEAGVAVVESDPAGHTVGLGGYPDRDGVVTLDACIMNHKSQCGAVAYLQDIEHPISVARKVMEETPHVMLVGDGALQFALAQGFPRTELLTSAGVKAWKKWKETSTYKPGVNIENHDTIGALALDADGNLSGACTTSGMAFKMHGRVGDSPIIGAGLFVDNEVGAACATGMGEAIVRIAGSAIVVELMRNGHSPQEACEEAVKRVIAKHENLDNLQVCFIALNRKGEYGAYSVYQDFNFAVKSNQEEALIDAQFKLKL